jgi:hypothetical protein
MKVKEVRYLRTSALTRVIGPLDERSVASLAASRSSKFESTGTSPLPYLRVSEKGVRELDISYNFVRHGPLNKAGLLAGLSTAFQEAVIQELDIFMPTDFSKMIAERVVAPETSKADLRKTRFVMHLDHYPCRRDGAKNKFWADIEDAMTDEEKTWMERASLDLDHFVPAEVFRTVSLKKGRVGGDWADDIKKWKDTIGTKPDLIRDGLILVYPDPDIRNRRDYEWKDEKKWILRTVGGP